MSGRSNVTIEIGKYEYERLKEKAEEYGEDIKTILEWLIEEHIDEV